MAPTHLEQYALTSPLLIQALARGAPFQRCGSRTPGCGQWKWTNPSLPRSQSSLCWVRPCAATVHAAAKSSRMARSRSALAMARCSGRSRSNAWITLRQDDGARTPRDVHRNGSFCTRAQNGQGKVAGRSSRVQSRRTVPRRQPGPSTQLVGFTVTFIPPWSRRFAAQRHVVTIRSSFMTRRAFLARRRSCLRRRRACAQARRMLHC